MNATDIVDIQLDHFLGNTDRLADAFAAVDTDGFWELLTICKDRGIDPQPALALAWHRGNRFATLMGEKKATVVSGTMFRVPVRTTEER